MMITKSRLILLALLSSSATLAHAELELKVDYNFYSISPSTQEEILPELNSKSPIRMQGRVAHGITKVSLQWRPIMRAKDEGCELTQIVSSLSLRYTLPKLELESPNSELQATFDNNYEILHSHELGHGELAIQAANSIEEQLVGMSHEGSCAALEQQAIEKAKGIYAHYKKMELEYDKLTDHGRQQSVVDTPIPAPQS